MRDWLAHGNRKLLVVMAALTYTFVLAILHALTTDFSTVVSICVPAFAAANSFEHYASTKNPT